MPKNKGKRVKNRRRGKNENEDLKREIAFREDGQEYAQVTKMLGNGRLEALTVDYQDAKADLILKYSAEEARNLKTYGEFPETVKINETVTFGEETIDDEIEFDVVGSSEEETNEIDSI
ncbi:EIF1A [Lepeophtheirus salmonis]|uniref:EIF1A n=1 Tax=Lepeophtheirus salmonis TaxID=72036 RepID=A0A7R8H691_LEPSM|nr:EIF1A [Lepeophtheirus salmonis]CAF2897396.1 EIF1A [Lepeophtheirus salmonis]